MTINDLKAKVTAAEERVVKIEGTIERHRKAREKKVVALEKIVDQYNLRDKYNTAETDPRWYFFYKDEPFYTELAWAISDVEDKDIAIHDATKKLEDTKKIVKNWTAKLRAEEVKQQYIQDSIPQIIKDFLLEWKRSMIDIFNNMRDEYKIDIVEYRQFVNRQYYEYMINSNEDRSYLHIDLSEYNPEINYEHIAGYKSYKIVKASKMYEDTTEEFRRKYSNPFFTDYLRRKFDEEWLDKVLTEEMNAKLVDMMTRVSKVTGEIVDASHLSITKGCLNGYIIGKDGNATVETIGAAGYNDRVILDSGRHGQVFHFRTLVKPKK